MDGSEAEIPEEWKELYEKIEQVDTEAVAQWMDHPKKGRIFVNFTKASIGQGRTILHCAIVQKRLDIAEILLDKGADPRISDKDGYTALMAAGSRGFRKIVERLLDKGADPNIINMNGNTALIQACGTFFEYIKTVEVLLEKGADPNISNNDGYTALIDASSLGHFNIVKLLLEKGADTNISNKYGKTALIYASGERYSNIVQALLEYGADPNISDTNGNTALIDASSEGHVYIVQLLLEKGADPGISNDEGYNALIQASKKGRTETVELLLEKGADLNSSNRFGDTPLILASREGHMNVVEVLLDKDVDTSISNKVGDNALINASSKGHTSIVARLVEKSADINTSDKFGDTPLYRASLYGYGKIVAILLESGADPDICNNDGDFALIKASRGGYPRIVELLLEHDADPNIADKSGNTALIDASDEGQVYIVELLLQEAVDINVSNSSGQTPLIQASKKGHTKTVELLVEKGADVDISNKFGDTPLILACREGHTSIMEVLLDNDADPNISNYDGDNALIIQCNRGGDTFIVARLIERGVDVNISDKYGDTPAYRASLFGHNDILQLLLEKGADPNIANNEGDLALIQASLRGHAKTAELLLEHDADPNISNKHGSTPLILASSKGHTDVVKLLLEMGAEISISNEFGDTALIEAYKGSHTKTAEVLLEKGANPNEYNGEGQTHLHTACLENNLIKAQQMLEAGTDKDTTDNYGHTALFYAAEKGSVHIVKLLLAYMVDANKTDERRKVSGYESVSSSFGSGCSHQSSRYSVKDGRTPLFIASQNGHHDVVAILLQYGADQYLCNNESKIPSEISVVHGPIQQLFRIQDYLNWRERRDDFQLKYRTCNMTTHGKPSQREKNPPSPLEDIIHDMVKYPQYAEKFLELYQENRDVVNWLDKDRRTVRQVACKECRDVTLFMGRYDLDNHPKYESETCMIFNALDHGDPLETNTTEPRQVVMKFFEIEEHFVNEMRARRSDEHTPRFSSEFVTPDLAAYRADQDMEYAKACRTWKTNGTDTTLLSNYCLVMERGERSLLEAMNAENLSSKPKDLQRREMLLTLCQIFSHIHESGFVHGDIKPHNVVRHTGLNVTWKAIDFDACTKIGDVVGRKLTTGSAPPEMLKIIKEDEEDKESMGKSKIILRQQGADGLDDSELVKADPSFDVWSYGILMYELVTGMSFFHCDHQGNVVDSGLQELASLTESRINEKLTSVQDVNVRVLLSRILRLDPNERPSMSTIGQDYYFHPSESPQGRKAEFFGKQVFSIFVPQVDALQHNDTPENMSSTFESGEMVKAEKDEDGESGMLEIETFLSSTSEFSYFKLRDEDKDWSDKLLNSEIETFRFDKLEGMGEKPKIIDGDTIYQNNFLRGLLSNRGPDYFMGFLVEFFELYKIMNDAHTVCQGIKANLVSDVKSLKGTFTKLFVRGKGLNDIVRGTLFCNSIDQFKYVGRQLNERYGYNVCIKPPRNEAGAWPIPKLLIYGERRVDERCMSVEIQFSTVYMHLAAHASNNHLVYEAIRESTGYLVDKDKEFHDFLQSLNQQHIDTEGFLRSQSAQEGRFEVLVKEVGGKRKEGETYSQESDKQCMTKATGFILGGRIRCGDHIFQFLSPKDQMQRFSESSFVVNKSLTLLSSHSYWSDELFDLEGKSVEFEVSFKGRGLAIAGIGTTKCTHGKTESDGDGGTRCSVHVGRSKFVVRKSGVEQVFREKKLPDQERAKIIFKILRDGVLLLSFVGSNKEDHEEESAKVSILPNQRYYLYMRAPPGVHDVKFHDISIKDEPKLET